MNTRHWRTGLLAALLVGASTLGLAVEEGEIRLPAGIDQSRLRDTDKGERMRVYVSLLGYEDARGGAAVYPGSLGEALGNVTGMNRRFMDMVANTRRFQVFDDTETGIRDASDVVVTGQLTRVSQILEPFTRGRKALTTVALSIQIKDSLTGHILDQHEAVETLGQHRGEGAWAMRPADVDTALFQGKLRQDLITAYERALAHAAAHFESSMRPLAKVVGIDGHQVQLLGGRIHGLSAGDELVVFSAATLDASPAEFQRSLKPLARIRCDAVGGESSTCVLTRREVRVTQPRSGHFAVLSDESLKLRFE